MAKKNEQESELKHHTIVINNVANANAGDYGKPRGSIFWLIFWIFVFFPIAIFYFFIRRWN